MTQQFSLGEQVAQLVEYIDGFYSLSQTSPLSRLIEARALETRQRLASLRQKDRGAGHEGIRIAIHVKGFDGEAEDRLSSIFPMFTLAPADEAEVIIADPHSPQLDALLSADALRVFWAHDHHHSFAHYVIHLLKANIVFPAHFCRRDHLQAFNAHIADTVPATTNQWMIDQLEFFSRQSENGLRSDDLYGGFGAYDVGLQRSFFIGAIMEQLPRHALSVRRIQSEDDPYFTLSWERRLAEWRRYKVSLCAAISQDIPIRLFDALATGQIPIIPNNVTNLDWVIPLQDQSRLGIERYEANDPGSAIAAWRRALNNFDHLGPQGINDRISYFLEHHSIVRRVERIVRTILAR